MIKELIDSFKNGSGLSKGLVIYCVFALIIMLIVLLIRIKDNPKKKIALIDNAIKKNHVTSAIMTCLTLHGKGKPEYYRAEYMYMVDEQSYFITYKMAFDITIDDRRNEMNADMLCLQIPRNLTLYYENSPHKVISKYEIFASRDVLDKTYTDQNNIYRDIQSNWSQSIDLVSYTR